eukprot:s5766_g4.t1
MQQRKQQNWLSRATRLLELMDTQQLSAAQQTERLTLLRRLGFRSASPSAVNADDLQQQIMERHQQLQRQQSEESKQRIQQWQASMREDAAERRRWLKRTTHPQFPQVTHDDTILPTDQQVLAKLHEHWEQTWSRAKQTPSSRKTQTLLENLPQHLERSGRPAETEFLVTWRSLKGAEGPDNWAASEIKALPEEVIACFGQVTCQWEMLGTIPDALTFSRQVHLPKDSKGVRGKVEVKHMRPTNVYSLWYRLWSSTWARSQLIKTWRCETLPSAISGGAGSPGTEVLASQSADALHSMGWLATVDYSLAFDYIDAQAVTQAMMQLGIPARLAQVLCEQWTNQKRLLQWRRSTCPTTLRTDIAVPQGDPMSPLALNICMYAGLRFVEKTAPAEQTCRMQQVYMDDRTWTASSPALLTRTLHAWYRFSELAGLCENPDKTQLICATERRKRALHRHLCTQPDLRSKVCQQACVLGCIIGKSKACHPKEAERLKAATQICEKIAVLPVAHRVKLAEIRTLVMSKAAYGWIAKRPSVTQCARLDRASRGSSKAFAQGPIPLHNLLEGATTCLDVVVGSKQVSLWLKRQFRENWSPQQCRDSIIANEARDWLRKTGWEPTRNGWQHPDLRDKLDTRFGLIRGRVWDEVARKKVAHLTREGWRATQWKAFTTSTRREARELRNFPYDEQRFSHVRATAALTEGATLAILYGSSVSPAAFVKRAGMDAALGRCPFCGSDNAFHKHLFWECQERPKHLQKFQARDALQARLGWPLGHRDRYGVPILKQMTDVLEVLWTHRHSHEPETANSYRSRRAYRPKGMVLKFTKARRAQKPSKKKQ